MTTTQPEHPVFLDSEGTPIEIGDKVHFVPDEEDPQEPWTSKRSGIVLDMGQNELGHQSLFMHEYGDRHRLEGRWARDEFICGPERLKVISKANYGLAEKVSSELNALLDEAVTLMNLPRDVALGRILDRESGRGGLQRAVHAISRTMKSLGVKEA